MRKKGLLLTILGSLLFVKIAKKGLDTRVYHNKTGLKK